MTVLIIFVLVALFNGVFLDDPCKVTNFDDIPDAISNCKKIILKDVIIPEKTTLTMHLEDGTELIFDGNITHVPVEWPGDLIQVYGNNLTISGTKDHVFDGLGAKHWKAKNEALVMRPKMLRFKLTNSTIKNLNLLNCPHQCIHISSSSNVHVSNIFIDVQGGYQDVPNNHFATNTAGMIFSDSDRIFVKNIVMLNEDDCMIITGGHDISFQYLFCTGALGLTVSKDVAYNIEFIDCTVLNAKQAIHIKTFNNGTEGHIYNVVYKNMKFEDITETAISIQQNYPEGEVRGNIPITNLTLTNVSGTVLEDAVPVSILCAEDACSDWSWTNVKITGSTKDNECLNVPANIDC